MMRTSTARGALIRREDRIQIDFENLGKIIHQLGNFGDDIGQRRAVDTLSTAHAIEQLRAADGIEHR